MIAELGHLALILALLVALVQGTLPIVGATRGIAGWIAVARPAAQAQMAFLSIAFAALAFAFYENDFSVLYVASHSNSGLPVEYRLAAVWGGHEGSMLLWVLLLAGWSCAVALLSRRLPDDMVARILGVMGLVSCGLLLFLLLTSNPFQRLLPAAQDGRDLNPLLQDPGMVFHPPILYMGYVGFSVAFAFAIGALLDGRLDAAWARWSRPWTQAAWCFLTLGIALGSYWAYYELGWGGWWFWDPVENASFMPWLIGTALMHSLAVTEKRGSFKVWTVLLAIVAFSLCLLGTFLVRSGVLTSVHAFATDPRRGVFVLAFLAVVVGSSLALFAWRAPKIGLGGRFELFSRETMLLINNLVFAVAAAAVMLGTLYPLVLDALGAGRISVGAPYFEAVFAPLMAPALFLIGVGPLTRWREASLPDLVTRLKWAFAASLAGAVVLTFALGSWRPLVAGSLMLALWIGCGSVMALAGGNMRALWPRLRATSRAQYGMALAHLGVAVFIVGVTLVKGYETERDVRMEAGDTTQIDAYLFRFDNVAEVNGPNYVAARATISVLVEDRVVATLHPEKRLYRVQRMPMTEAAIDKGFLRDLYVALGEPAGGQSWTVRVYLKPFVSWIWGGCLLMAIGGALAASDRRYRRGLAGQGAPVRRHGSMATADGGTA